MKRLIIIYVVLILAVIGLAFFQRGNIAGLFGGNASVTIKGKTYKVMLAKTEKERQVGLSGRNSLNKDEGMLFVYSDKGLREFWMKDTKFPLDIIHINDNKIVDIIKNAPPPAEGTDVADLPVYKPNGEANYVLELNAGEANNFKVGDTVEFKNIK